jgi:DNA-directed RNA polymerase specialized sigma24 family protein
VSDFELFLSWLSPDAETAGRRYTEIHTALTKIFTSRGCEHPQELADRTLDRVIRKVRMVAPGYAGEPVAYIHAVAKRVFLEAMRTQRRVLPMSADGAMRSRPLPDPELERRHASLDQCLGELADDDRALILHYYSQDRSARIAGRQLLARDAEISAAALRKRVQRIRERLKASLMERFGTAAFRPAAGM